MGGCCLEGCGCERLRKTPSGHVGEVFGKCVGRLGGGCLVVFGSVSVSSAKSVFLCCLSTGIPRCPATALVQPTKRFVQFPAAVRSNHLSPEQPAPVSNKRKEKGPCVVSGPMFVFSCSLCLAALMLGRFLDASAIVFQPRRHTSVNSLPRRQNHRPFSGFTPSWPASPSPSPASEQANNDITSKPPNANHFFITTKLSVSAPAPHALLPRRLLSPRSHTSRTIASFSCHFAPTRPPDSQPALRPLSVSLH
jgi:hypothetical protein